jgi:hypothetical protein
LAIADKISACPPAFCARTFVFDRPANGEVVRPVDLDDLLGDLGSRKDIGRGPIRLWVLQAQIDEADQHGVLVGGREPALVEQI